MPFYSPIKFPWYDNSSFIPATICPLNHIKGNRGDMRKIYGTQQFSRLAALRVTFSKKQKPVFRYGLGERVYQISGLYLFSLWLKGAVQTRKPTYLQIKIETSSTGCLPPFWIFFLVAYRLCLLGDMRILTFFHLTVKKEKRSCHSRDFLSLPQLQLLPYLPRCSPKPARTEIC